MADVEIDIIGHDHTAAATASADRNLRKVDDSVKKVGKSSEDTDRSISKMAKSAERSSSMMTTMGAKLLGAGGAVAGMIAFKVVADALAGSVLLGVGAAMAAVAIKAQSMTNGVQNAFASLKQHVVETSVGMSAAFGPALVRIAGIARTTFDNLVPDLTIAFRKMAPAVQRFAGDLGKAFGALRPAIQPLTDGFVRLLAAAGPALQSAMGSVARGLAAIGDEMNRRPEAFAGFIEDMGKLAEATLKTGAFLNDFGTKFKENLTLLGLEAHRQAAMLAGDSAGVAKWVEAERQQVEAMSPGLHTAAQATATLSDGEQVLVEQAKAAADALDKQHAAALAASDANIALEQAIDDATKGLQKGAHALDINTQKGRDNTRALNNIAASAFNAAKAARDHGEGEQAASAAIARGRGAYIKLLTDLGVGKTKAGQMADAIGLIPTSHKTKVTADTGSASAAVESFQRRIDNLHGKTVSVTVVTRGSTGTLGKKIMAKGGIIDEPVMGVGARTGREYLIGEAGPEAVVPLSGGKAAGPVPGGAGLGGPVNVQMIAPNYIGPVDVLKRALTDLARTGQLQGVLRTAGVRL